VTSCDRTRSTTFHAVDRDCRRRRRRKYCGFLTAAEVLWIPHCGGSTVGSSRRRKYCGFLTTEVLRVPHGASTAGSSRRKYCGLLTSEVLWVPHGGSTVGSSRRDDGAPSVLIRGLDPTTRPLDVKDTRTQRDSAVGSTDVTPRRAVKLTQQTAAPGATSAVYDCLETRPLVELWDWSRRSHCCVEDG